MTLNLVAEIAAAEAAGLTITRDGTDLIVTGLDALSTTAADHWRVRLKAAKAAILTFLSGNGQHAASALWQFGIEVVVITSGRVAERLVARIVEEAGNNHVGLDVETMAIPAEKKRQAEVAERIAYLTGREKGLKKAGKPVEAAAVKQDLKFTMRLKEHADEAPLDPNRGTPRLLQVYPGGDKVYIFDMLTVPWLVLAPLQSLRFVAHNSAFELKQLAACGFVSIHPVECTMQMSGLLLGSYRRSLKVAAAEYLGLSVSKTEQDSDWSVPTLSQAQLDYAALDPVLTLKCAKKMLPALGPSWDAYRLQRDAQVVASEMEGYGIYLDVGALNALIADLRQQRADLERAYERDCQVMGRVDLASRGIPNTDEQKRELLNHLLSEGEKRAWKLTSAEKKLAVGKSELLRGAHYPPIARLAEFSTIDKFLSSFGPGLIAEVSPITGRLHPSINVAQARSGRASYANPPLQQIPKDKRYRRLFAAAPGYLLVGGDYATMELRAAAWIANDPVMTAAFIHAGEPGSVDLHTLTAMAMTGKPASEITKDERENAKRVNFGAAYGMGAATLVQKAWDDYQKVILLCDAETWLRAFKLKYGRFAAWCRENAELCKGRGYVIIGRDAKRGIGRIHRFSANRIGQSSYTQSCNLPIQGQCADCSMLALIKIHRALREADIPGRIVIWNHDEIVAEVPAEHAEATRLIVNREMTAAFSETFPGAPLKGLVEAKIGRNWAETK